jgi:hypothetical protein
MTLLHKIHPTMGPMPGMAAQEVLSIRGLSSQQSAIWRLGWGPWAGPGTSPQYDPSCLSYTLIHHSRSIPAGSPEQRVRVLQSSMPGFWGNAACPFRHGGLKPAGMGLLGPRDEPRLIASQWVMAWRVYIGECAWNSCATAWLRCCRP